MTGLFRREMIEEVLEENRGMSFTKLKQETSLENGVLSYHIRKSEKLEKHRGAVVHREKCRECPLRKFCSEKCIFRLLESEKTCEVLEARLEGKRNVEIAEEVGLHRSTVTYHVSKLEENGLIDEEAWYLLESEDAV
ncbi:MAG: helix-turn-helix domain-containing protein [Candidatus Nanosalina sp.]